MIYVPETGTRFWYQFLPDCITHVPDFGTSFLVPESDTGFLVHMSWSLDLTTT